MGRGGAMQTLPLVSKEITRFRLVEGHVAEGCDTWTDGRTRYCNEEIGEIFRTSWMPMQCTGSYLLINH